MKDKRLIPTVYNNQIQDKKRSIEDILTNTII